jgi:hypothetical protein
MHSTQIGSAIIDMAVHKCIETGTAVGKVLMQP